MAGMESDMKSILGLVRQPNTTHHIMTQRLLCGSAAFVDVRFSISARTVSNTLPGRGSKAGDVFGGSRVKLERGIGGLTDIDVLLCAGLEEGGLVCVCQLLALERVDLAAEKKSVRSCDTLLGKNGPTDF